MIAGAISWTADNALNVLAWLALRVAPPMRAAAWVRQAGRCCPAIDTPAQARKAIRRLSDRGSCLSRALAVGVRCAGSQVVIGVNHTADRESSGGRPFQAHAWVEVAGDAVQDGTASLWVELGRFHVGRRMYAR